MKTRLLFLLVLLLCLPSIAQINTVSETFESVTENQVPVGWQKYSNIAGYTAGAYTFSTWAYQGSKSLMINPAFGAGDIYIILPQTINARGVLSFYARSINGNATVQIGSATSNTDMSTFTPIGSAYTATATYANINLNLNSHVRNDEYVVIKTTHSSSVIKVCLDNITYNTTCEISNDCTNNALNFDGVNDRVVTPITPSSVANTGTIEAWIKTSDAGTGFRGIVTKPSHVGLFLNDNKLMTYVWTQPASSAAITIPSPLLNDNQWHHVALTFQMLSFNNQLYIDGVAVGSSFYLSSLSNSNAINIGSNTTTQYFNGNIDEVRVWGRILSASEISNIYSCGSVSNTNLLVYYSFNSHAVKNQGNIGLTTLVNDTGATASNGTLENFTLNGATSNYSDDYYCGLLSTNEYSISNKAVTLYPNPVKDNLFISIENASLEIEEVAVYDITGKRVKLEKGNIASLSVQDLKSGFYILEISTTEGKVVKKFTKE